MTHTFKTDVLVIGGGAAGVRAAIEAKQRGRRVSVLSESKIGKANNSVISFGGFAAAVGDDSPEQHFQDTMNGGQWLNQQPLVRLLTEQVPGEVLKLEEMGVQFQKDENGRYIQVARGGHSVARRLTTATNSGKALIDPLVKTLDQLVDNRLEGLRAIRLLTIDGTISGVLAIDKQGEWHVVSAKAVVLATGGGGALYPANSNVRFAVGEGYALALEAGLSLRDMEFVQFVAGPRLGPDGPRRGLRLPPLEFLLIHGAVLRNSEGEDLFELIGISTFTRDVITTVVERENQRSGLGKGGVKLDISQFSFEGMGDISDYMDLDIQVQTAAHFFMGGIEVNDDLTTAIPGFFAAGEVMGGVHGANRLGGNALAETFVFGAQIGGLAAQFASENKTGQSIEPGIAKQVIEEVTESQGAGTDSKSSNESVLELEKELKVIMGEFASPVRTLDLLNEGLNRIVELKNTLQSFAPPAPEQLWARTSFRNQLITAEAVLHSARIREESRGAHVRDDFPETDEKGWRGNIILQKDQNEGLKHVFRPV
jgi:fumarate reductase (CoM/CoB) subunit A